MVNWTYVIVTVVYAAMAAGGCVVSNANAAPLTRWLTVSCLYHFHPPALL